MSFTKEQLEEMKQDKYVVWVNDEPISRINSNLIISKKINDSDLEKLKQLHIDKFKLFELVDIASEKETEKLKSYALDFENIEYDLQELWGFPKNSDFHQWYTIPKCVCPDMDNADRSGINERVYTDDCPVHNFPIPDKVEEKCPVEQDIEDEAKYKDWVGKWVAYDVKGYIDYVHIGLVKKTSYQILMIEHSGLYMTSSHNSTNKYESQISVEDETCLREATDLEITMHKNSF